MKIKKAKNLYESVKIPKEFNRILCEEKIQVNKKRNIFNPILSTVCIFCFTFVALVNINPGFAKATYEIPFICNLAKIVSIKEYRDDNDEYLIHVKMPAIENTGNTELENKINKEIENKINLLLAESKQRVKEFKQELENGNYEDFVFYPMEVEVNYEVKYSNENIVSFVIVKSESFYNFFEEKYYYNIDLNTGNDITLKDLLGENYKEIATNEISKQIENRKKTDENAMFFDEEDNHFLEHGAAFDEIDSAESFYINSYKKPVIVFPKYSIAPGYMGELEFEI